MEKKCPQKNNNKINQSWLGWALARPARTIPLWTRRGVEYLSTWWFKVTFLGWLSDPFKGWKRDLQRSGMKFGHFESPGSWMFNQKKVSLKSKKLIPPCFTHSHTPQKKDPTNVPPPTNCTQALVCFSLPINSTTIPNYRHFPRSCWSPALPHGSWVWQKRVQRHPKNY